jgi:glycosyltransferase involved in cell wall biosynthesis
VRVVIPVTLIVTTRNEAVNIARCLQSARGLCEQIFVLDSESRDATVEIARRYGEVVELPYDHTRIIPWIFQWGLDHLPIRTEWILILEADQAISPALHAELVSLFARPRIVESGFYVRRQQVFRGKTLRFGGYGAKYMLKLFRRGAGALDPEEADTRVYVTGRVGRLRAPIIEANRKEDQILFYLEKHLRYVEVFAREELRRRRGELSWKQAPRFWGTPDQRVLWLKRLFFRLPLYARPIFYFCYRYVFLLGFLDGRQGAVFHFLQAFWFRLVWDLRLEELIRESAEAGATNVRQVDRSAARVD